MKALMKKKLNLQKKFLSRTMDFTTRGVKYTLIRFKALQTKKALLHNTTTQKAKVTIQKSQRNIPNTKFIWQMLIHGLLELQNPIWLVEKKNFRAGISKEQFQQMLQKK